MRTIRRLSLVNFGPFRGRHDVQLEEKAYAVLARAEDDADRSNFLGKSTLLSAIPFLLFGKHPWRVDEEMITWGEDRAIVEALFDGGEIVTREKARKGSVQTRFLPEGAGGVTLSQAAAEEEIERRVGLSHRDFFASCFFEQKQISRLVDCETDQLLEILSAWFRLDKLDAASDAGSRAEQAVEEERERVERDLHAALAVENEHVANTVMLSSSEEIEKAVDAARERARKAQATLATVSARRRAWLDAEQLREVAREGKALAEEIEKAPRSHFQAHVEKLQTEQGEAFAAARGCSERWRAAQRVAEGKFDGVCPVVGAECPARKQIDGMRDQAAKKADVEKDDLAHARYRVEEASRTLQEGLRLLAGAQGRGERLERLRAERDALLGSARETPEAEPSVEREAEESGEAQRALAWAEGAQAQRVEADRRAQALGEKIKGLEGKLADVGKRLAVARAARFALSETTRQIAEGRMREISGQASRVLAEAGVPIEVSARWEREAQGLSAICRGCGALHPKSQAVKACQACGEPRGPKMVRAPAFVPSRRSGGADDLAGIAVQIAAGAWLRRDRSSEWASVFLDEPTGSVDKSFRKAFATSFVRMLSEVGAARQSFVVSHDAATLDAMPARIVIVGASAGSSIKVVG